MLDTVALRIGVSIGLSACGIAGAVAFGEVAGTAAAAICLALAHLVRVPSSSGRGLSLSAAVAAAVAMLTGGSVTVLLAGAAVGMPIGWLLVRWMHGRRAVDDIVPEEPIALVGFALVYRGTFFLVGLLDSAVDVMPYLPHFVGLMVGGVCWLVAAAVARGLWSGRRRRVSGRLLWRDALGDWPAYPMMIAAAGLFAVSWPVMGPWAVPLATLPYGFSHVALERLITTRRAYRQTIKALGKLPEAAGHVESGHAERTADLAVAIGSALGFSPREATRVEYAALLYDIGRVALGDPAVARSGYSEADLDRWSTAILGEVSYLDHVTDIISLRHRAYRRPGQVRDPEVPRASQVLRVASHYDRAVERGGMLVVDALESFHRGGAYDYDPEVVGALRRVLERRGVVVA